MYKHAPTSIKSILNELVAAGEMLQQVFVVDIVHFDDLVRESFEELWIQWEFQN